MATGCASLPPWMHPPSMPLRRSRERRRPPPPVRRPRRPASIHSRAPSRPSLTMAPSCARSSVASSPSPAARAATPLRWDGWWSSSWRWRARRISAVLGHLSEIEPSLLDLDSSAAPLIIGPNELLGRYGVILPPGESPALECPAVDLAAPADPTADELFAAMLRGATVTSEGEIVGGTPISPEPLVGELGYEGLAWWHGPLSAVEIAEEAGRPRASWNRRTPANASHVIFGRPIRLVARVRDRADLAQVRFRAFYPSWPRPGGGRDLAGFDPRRDWRQLALCTPPQGRRGDRELAVPLGWRPRRRHRHLRVGPRAGRRLNPRRHGCRAPVRP